MEKRSGLDRRDYLSRDRCRPSELLIKNVADRRSDADGLIPCFLIAGVLIVGYSEILRTGMPAIYQGRYHPVRCVAFAVAHADN